MLCISSLCSKIFTSAHPTQFLGQKSSTLWRDVGTQQMWGWLMQEMSWFIIGSAQRIHTDCRYALLHLQSPTFALESWNKNDSRLSAGWFNISTVRVFVSCTETPHTICRLIKVNLLLPCFGLSALYLRIYCTYSTSTGDPVRQPGIPPSTTVIQYFFSNFIDYSRLSIRYIFRSSIPKKSNVGRTHARSTCGKVFIFKKSQGPKKNIFFENLQKPSVRLKEQLQTKT